METLSSTVFPSGSGRISSWSTWFAFATSASSMDSIMASVGEPLRAKRVLIIVENLPVPFDRRVWNEATTLVKGGYEVSVICPTGHNATARHEVIDGVHIYRHPIFEARGMAFYFVEYGVALFWEFVLAWRVYLTRGFDVIHACNPPDLIFL